MKVKPISPKVLIEARKNPDLFPPEIIEAFNDLIAKKFNGNEARVDQKEALELALAKMKSKDPSLDTDKYRKDIFNNGWFDIEPLFREQGWEVHYDKPGYNESYEAFFVFSTKRKKWR